MRLPRVRFTVWRMIAAVAVAVLCLAWLSLTYKPSHYRGDGTITDGGFWSYPRYRIRLPPMPVQVEEVHRYRLRGVPPVPLTFRLEVVGQRPLDEKDLDPLASVGTCVSVTVADEHGRPVASASGPLRDWELSRSSGYAAFWHPELRQTRLRERAAYILTVTASGEDPGPPLVLTPTLEGGGIEFP
jgi:hypothetical protein